MLNLVYWFKYAKFSIFNLKNKFFPQLTDAQVKLIKDTKLFNQLDALSFKKLIQSSTQKFYLANDLIFKEGDLGDTLYIISAGSVRVFTRNIAGKKISLARLDTGSYFGEQALLGQFSKTRNASIEAITDVLLIRIREKFLVELLHIDKELENRLKEIGNQQVINKLSSALDIYQHIQPTLQKWMTSDNMVEVPPGDVIFKTGESSDYVYFILSGSVKISADQDNNEPNIILTTNQMFGELGVINDTSRSRTAIAQEPSRILRVSAAKFKELYPQSPQLQKLLHTLQSSYCLPKRGSVQQYIGEVSNMNTITTIYKMDDGRSVAASNIIGKDYFAMQVENESPGQLYIYEKGDQHKVELHLHDNYLTMIKCYGTWDSLAIACSALLDRTLISANTLSHFKKTGTLQLEISQSPSHDCPNIICGCLGISKKSIQELINSGINELDQLSNKTGVCTVCRACRVRLLDMLGESVWLAATMKKCRNHTDNIASYYIQPSLGTLMLANPGQYIIVQARIGENWIERAYTLSDLIENNRACITIKKEKNGLFTKWLFENNTDEIPVYVSQPQGNFILTEDATSVLCFAGGIGITPFITFAKSTHHKKNKQRLHVVYSALTQKDFIFTEEFMKINTEYPTVTFEHWAADEMGLLTKEKIIQAIHSLNQPDIYICGPEGFEKSIRKALTNIKYSPDKIHVEQFTYASPIAEA